MGDASDGLDGAGGLRGRDNERHKWMKLVTFENEPLAPSPGVSLGSAAESGARARSGHVAPAQAETDGACGPAPARVSNLRRRAIAVEPTMGTLRAWAGRIAPLVEAKRCVRFLAFGPGDSAPSKASITRMGQPESDPLPPLSLPEYDLPAMRLSPTASESSIAVLSLRRPLNHQHGGRLCWGRRILEQHSMPQASRHRCMTKALLPGMFLFAGLCSGGHAGAQTVSFSPPVLSQLPQGSPRSVALTDINRDGIPDLVAVGSSGSQGQLWALLGDGAGHFTQCQQVNIGASTWVKSLVLADINGDSIVDALSLGDFGTTRALITNLGTSAPAFSGPTYTLLSGANLSAYYPDLVIVDINHDGILDACIAATNGYPDGSVRLLIGDGAGGFTDAGGVPFPLAGNLDSGDFNGDGLPDICACTTSGAPGYTIQTFIGNGTPRLVIGPTYTWTYPNLPQTVRMADMSQDGFDDVVVSVWIDPNPSHPSGGSISVFFGNSGFQLGAPIDFPVPTKLADVALVDLDGFGLDVAGTGVPNGSVLAMHNDGGTGTLDAALSFDIGGAAVPEAHSIAVGDVNGDGLPDVVSPLATGAIACVPNTTQLLPNALVPYGTGTPGCSGPHTLSGTTPPKIGTANFGLRCDKAPAGQTGLWMITDSQDVAGSDPFAIGAKLHVDLFGASNLITLNATADSNGIAIAYAAIPNYPFLVGSTFYAQTIWAWPLSVCFNFPFGISSSNGLAITILP